MKIKTVPLIFLVLAIIFCDIHTTKAENVILLNTYNGFLTSTGYYIFGEIENNENYPIKDVALNIKFNLNNSEQITYTTTTSLPIILKGRKSPFSFILTDKTLAERVQDFSISIQGYKEAKEKPSIDLIFSSHAPTNDSIYGVVRYQGEKSTSFVTVFATFYDENHKILAVNPADIIPTLSRGNPGLFEIRFPFSQHVKEVRWYSLTAYSHNPENTVQEEVNFAAFTKESEKDNGLSPILVTFIISVVFSALVLIGAYAVAKINQRRKRGRRIKRKLKV
ncbi:MAG: hypothetical protein ACTSYR_01450 [Candidatus Odinarchaeia archaeon]